MAKLPKPSLFSFEYVVQNVMVDPEDEQTVHWMGLESSEEAAWRQEHNGGATAFQESKEMRLRYRLHTLQPGSDEGLATRLAIICVCAL